jgi:hypothetical protein
MDYSAANESSPWASSSPHADRTGFPSTGSAPDSPTATMKHSRVDSEDNVPEQSIFAEPSNGPAATTIHDGDIPDQSQHSYLTSEQNPIQTQSNSQQPQQAGQPQQKQGAARYHNVRQQRPVPSYKLQAKVTALERTGRKDPVLRFDVHVR